MNDEIKEILWIIKSCKQDYDKQKDGMHTFDYGELYLLYDYITTLQQENSNLKFSNQALNNELGLKLYELDHLDEKRNDLKKNELEEYKKVYYLYNKALEDNVHESKKRMELQLIIDKATEYINDNLYPVGNDVHGSDLPYDEAIAPLLNILQNGSDSQ